MAGVNRAILVGHVGKDVTIKNNGQGKPIALFSLATSESWRDKESGERKERTSWHNIVVFNETLARLCEHHVKKGSHLYLEGKIVTRSYEKDGEKKYTTEIVLDGFSAQIVLLDKSEGSGRPPPPESSDDYGSTKTREGSGGAPAMADDDIPFAPEWR